ncbi:MAG: ABC transporter ATP-binding protein, partial [Lewinella sp.]
VSRTEESLGGLRIIKSFGAERYQSGRFAELNDSYRYSLTRLLWRRDLSSPLTEFLGIATVAVLLLYGSRQVFAGTMEAGTFIAFIFAFYMVIDPAKNFSKAWYNVQKGLGALERVEDVLDVPVGVEERGEGEAVADGDGAQEKSGLRFHDVSFRYLPEGPDVLRGIDLIIPHGQVVALAGASGGGKSTIADLLPRFYDPTDGYITLDGKDLREYAIDELRGRFGIVSQEAILFNDTIYNNILFGMQGVTPEEVERAARVANAHDFIAASANGYQTNIGDRGTKLSGGQRQRLTIARAVLRNPDILILDEATSALDSESERLVQEALQRLLQNRTALVIAHRLSTIQNADQIVILDQGRIIERGTHGELLERGGAYRKLVELQEV